MSEPPGRFAFVLHPPEVEYIARKYPMTRWLPGRFVERVFGVLHPFEASHITGIVSATGARAEGWFIGFPWTTRVILDAPLELVYKRLIEAGRIAERLGAGILGLGAFLKIVGDRGVSVAQNLQIGVTTGNSLTAATAIDGTLLAATRMGIDIAAAQVAVVGATGSIGAACTWMLSRRVGSLILVARHRDRLDLLAERLRAAGTTPVTVTSDVRRAAGAADVVITVSSATDVLIQPEDLRPGAVVCDVARPRNVSRLVYERRNDVLVIDGGVIEVPGPVDFGLDFGFPPRTCEACMAETILLGLEHRYDDYTLGQEIDLAKVEEIHALMQKHGFRLSGLRRFERQISDDEVESIRLAGRGVRAPMRAVHADAPLPERL